jgi:hypothetical protein
LFQALVLLVLRIVFVGVAKLLSYLTYVFAIVENGFEQYDAFMGHPAKDG